MFRVPRLRLPNEDSSQGNSKALKFNYALDYRSLRLSVGSLYLGGGSAMDPLSLKDPMPEDARHDVRAGYDDQHAAGPLSRSQKGTRAILNILKERQNLSCHQYSGYEKRTEDGGLHIRILLLPPVVKTLHDPCPPGVPKSGQ